MENIDLSLSSQWLLLSLYYCPFRERMSSHSLMIKYKILRGDVFLVDFWVILHFYLFGCEAQEGDGRCFNSYQNSWERQWYYFYILLRDHQTQSQDWFWFSEENGLVTEIAFFSCLEVVETESPVSWSSLESVPKAQSKGKVSSSKRAAGSIPSPNSGLIWSVKGLSAVHCQMVFINVNIPI